VKGIPLLKVCGRGDNLRMWAEFGVWGGEGLHYEILITLEGLILGENFDVNLMVVHRRCVHNTTGCTVK